MYSSNNVKIVLMQDKTVVLVSVIFIAACNFHALVTSLRSGKIIEEKVFTAKSAYLPCEVYTQYLASRKAFMSCLML